MEPEKTKPMSFECPLSLRELIQQFQKGNPGFSLSQAIRSLITLGLSAKNYTPEPVKKAMGIQNGAAG